MERILVIGANGQIGSELVEALAACHGAANVIAADIDDASLAHVAGAACYSYERLDVLDRRRLAQVIHGYGVTQVYQLAALLSVTAEKMPLNAWTLNTGGLLNLLEIAREHSEGKDAGVGRRGLRLFWPSSIAVFGPHTPALETPQLAVMDPSTIYGISKQAGERLCEYYWSHYGVDVRSLRYPGVISYKAPPGGGTTDYAIEMLGAAARGERYASYLGPDAMLPMIYMPDAIRATLELMAAPQERIRVRSSYNLAGLSFSPRQLAQAIRRRLPAFEASYQPDERQAIADTWPRSVDDSHARADWGWQPRFGLPELVADMLDHLERARPGTPPAGAEVPTGELGTDARAEPRGASMVRQL